MKVLDLIFPKFCINCKRFGDLICSNCFTYLSFDTKSICLFCQKASYDGLTHPRCSKKYGIDGTFTGVVFNKISRKIVYQLKYRPYLSLLSEIASDLLCESLIQKEEFQRIYQKEKPVLVPIPLNSKKLRKRGYNQSEILAKRLSEKLNLQFSDVLLRVKETRSQVGLNKEERRENVRGAFEIKSGANFKEKTVFLIDDVLTTGATFMEASNILKREGMGKVFGIAFAKEQ